MWEYYVINIKYGFTDSLNNLGGMGWELISVVPLIINGNTKSINYYFKRQIKVK